MKGGSEMSVDNNKNKKPLRYKIVTAIGVTLCAVFGFFLICNITMIAKAYINPDKPASVIGITPLTVLSGSMTTEETDSIQVGDLIFIGKAEASQLQVGDVIAFKDGDYIVTHRIVDIRTGDNGETQWITKGDANNAEDENPVTADNLVGIYKFRIPKVGDFALFLQTPLGMVIFIGGPILIFFIYDTIARQKEAAKESQRNEEMAAELAKLRQLMEEKGNS